MWDLNFGIPHNPTRNVGFFGHVGFFWTFLILLSENLFCFEGKLLDYHYTSHFEVQFGRDSKMCNFLHILPPKVHFLMWDFGVFWIPCGIFSHIIPPWDVVGFFRVGCGKKSHHIPPPHMWDKLYFILR